MKVLTINIPDNIDLNNMQVAMIVASKLYEQGKLSLGQAAELAGITKRVFTEMLGIYNVSVFNYPATELNSDVENA